MIDIGYISLESPVVVISPPGPVNEDRSAGMVMVGDLRDVSVQEIGERMEEAKAQGFSVSGFDLVQMVEAARYARECECLMELDLSEYRSFQDHVLTALVRRLKESGATLSLRIDPRAIEGAEPAALRDAGLDLLHLDMNGLNGSSPKIIKAISDAGGPPIMVGENVGDFDRARTLLSMGATLISLRGADAEFVTWLSKTLAEYGDLIGWYNAPKHICAGGDLRGLSFCCPPVKNCPVQGALKRAGMTPKEFMEKKMRLARGTPLQHGDGTCFGSLVWCCKITKPCFMRDAVLHRLGLSERDYMELKRKLAIDLLRP
ncbi:MAG: methanogenesis marker 9 domain-containing protein [Methanotrichaceae archaeon]|nr:methanogenesis marker 9 domain-containing protein [Methanotrichaceae archaeon]